MLVVGGVHLGQAEDLPSLREQALAAVNADRKTHGLGSLSLSANLNEAAQHHADDMLERNYFEHASPEGEMVDDRYAAAGGPAWHLVAENLAQCSGCAGPVDQSRIQELETGWMNSPGHRANILRQGLNQFGFGLATKDDKLYAVQTFAGPGRPIGLQPNEQPEAVTPDEADHLALERINAVRSGQGVPPLQASDALTQVALSLLPDDPSGDFTFVPDDMAKALPADQQEAWAAFSASTAGCGGCGAVPMDVDIRYFTNQWLENPENGGALLSPSMTHLGFAMAANGDGRKLAMAVLGQER
ncbi:MAG TPA: CAP domain-containing protein [Geminicoccus sp.]|jgi:uncharacterized protein YkwD|uniref:CAP domain-containing protein n=1 Tax=Geminicoccus sp. TaxID=2024832 RepID=UPI002E2F0CC2|nr:CAP domain-containing protein [Geminicoccus sp.]HEX2527144.1 CAP domain-containing protein [Geminicoccus sp.]